MTPQETRHAQTPMVLLQIEALEVVAREASVHALASPTGKDIGHVLTSNMSAAFALELGLKLFYMTFFANGPPATHSLAKLYAGLPSKIRTNIAVDYRTNLPNSNIKIFGFQLSPAAPQTPVAQLGQIYATANELFAGGDQAFVAARYFFEQIGNVNWSTIEHPIDQMLHMSAVLRSVYGAQIAQAARSKTNP